MTMHTIAVGGFAPLFASIRGLLAQVAAGVTGLFLGIALIYLLVQILKHMGKGWEKLLVVVGTVLLAVVLAGAAPGLLASSYQWGKELGNGQPVDLTAQVGQ